MSAELAQTFTTKDTLFKAPYIDVDEMREKPVKHRYVHGGFTGTETRFSLYFPAKEAYQGRFFQYITPFPDNEFLSQGASGEDDKIGFSISSGAYFIETNGKHTFLKAGTFFPTVRIASQREGDDKTPFTRILNLDSVRVVVK